MKDALFNSKHDSVSLEQVNPITSTDSLESEALIKSERLPNEADDEKVPESDGELTDEGENQKECEESRKIEKRRV